MGPDGLLYSLDGNGVPSGTDIRVFNPNTLALGPIWFVIFLMSLTCHEAAHALVAKWGGDPTASLAGQVTLDPRPHIRRERPGVTV